MIVLLRRIPADTKAHEIADYLEPVLKGSFFQKQGQIDDIKMMVIKDREGNHLNFHGLVTIDSEAAAKRVIKKLNRKSFNGKHIAIREYIFRTWHNDQRINMGQRNDELLENRKKDRRHGRLEVLV